MERRQGDEDLEVRWIRAEVTRDGGRIRRLRGALEASDNVIRERVERHLEEVEIALVDAEARLHDLPATGSHNRRQLERDVRSLGYRVDFVEAKLDEAAAEERDDLRGMAASERAAVRAEGKAAAAELAVRMGPS